MIGTLGRVVIGFSVVVIFIVTAVQSYFNHEYAAVEARANTEELKAISENLMALMSNPKARPDAWSKTMDDDRSRDFCASIILLSEETPVESMIYEVLPDICLQQHDSSLPNEVID